LVFIGVGLFPKLACHRQDIDVHGFPPGHFIAGLMQLPVMTSAQGHGELVADFDP
jgi:hypothetical protein